MKENKSIFNICDYGRIFCHSIKKKVKERNEKIRNIKKAVLLTDSFRDIDMMIRKQYEFELLKSIVLNEHQNIGLSLAKNPVIEDFNRDQMELTSIPYSIFFMEKREKEKEFKEYYINRVKEGKLTNNDELVFSTLEDRYKNDIIREYESKETS
jgi:hypothetical protein